MLGIPQRKSYFIIILSVVMYRPVSLEEFLHTITKKYAEPFTENEKLIARFRQEASDMADICYNWGAPLAKVQQAVTEVFDIVLSANRDLCYRSGYKGYISLGDKQEAPLADYTDPEHYEEDAATEEWHMKLESLFFDALPMTGSSDSHGEEVVRKFPIFYDVWLQTVLTCEEEAGYILTILFGEK